jgi:hypothetical protein
MAVLRFGPGHPGDRETPVGGASCRYPGGHGPRSALGDGSIRVEQRRRDSGQRGLQASGVRDRATDVIR